MKSHTEHLTMHVPERRGFVNITGEVERVVRDSGVREGLVLVNAMHITASVFINDDRSEEHTSELQSLRHLVCRLLLEKKKKITRHTTSTLAADAYHRSM